jgi:hypothetical protein
VRKLRNFYLMVHAVVPIGIALVAIYYLFLALAKVILNVAWYLPGAVTWAVQPFFPEFSWVPAKDPAELIAVFPTEWLIFIAIAFMVEGIFTGFGAVIKDIHRTQIENWEHGSRFTGLYRGAGSRIDWRLLTKSTLWGALVYGYSAPLGFSLLDMLTPGFYGIYAWLRGMLGVIGIYYCEYIWGWFIESLRIELPWLYEKSTSRFWRVNNPYYAPFWFVFYFVGLELVHVHIVPALEQHLIPIIMNYFKALVSAL